MSRVYVGIDPSFKRTGISIYKNNKVIIDRACTEVNADKSFEAVFHDASAQVGRVLNCIRPYVDKEDEVLIISECPPPNGEFSPGLWGLDVLLFRTLQAAFKNNAVKIFRIYPNYLGHLHGKRKYSKTESLVMAQDMIKELNLDIFVLKGRMSHDEAESFLFLIRLLTREGLINPSIKGFHSEKEKQL